MERDFKTTEQRRKRAKAEKVRAKLRSDPNYKFKEIVRPAMWDETFLTERWEDRKARLAKERENRCD